jgi:hypothetical protein
LCKLKFSVAAQKKKKSYEDRRIGRGFHTLQDFAMPFIHVDSTPRRSNSEPHWIGSVAGMKRYLDIIFKTRIPGAEFETGYFNRVTKAATYYTIQNFLSLALKEVKMNHGNCY